jgi:hypothetical protein
MSFANSHNGLRNAQQSTSPLGCWRVRLQDVQTIDESCVSAVNITAHRYAEIEYQYGSKTGCDDEEVQVEALLGTWMRPTTTATPTSPQVWFVSKSLGYR